MLLFFLGARLFYIHIYDTEHDKLKHSKRVGPQFLAALVTTLPDVFLVIFVNLIQLMAHKIVFESNITK